MDQPTRAYKTDYANFMAAYVSGTTNAEQVGEMIARLSQHFSDANDAFGAARKAFNRLLKQIEAEVDDKGKLISTAKATSRAMATQEGENLIDGETDIKNIDNNINSLKSLQKGVLNEYSHMGNM